MILSSFLKAENIKDSSAGKISLEPFNISLIEESDKEFAYMEQGKRMVRPSVKNKLCIIFCIFIYCLVIPGCNDTSKPGIIIKDAHLYLPLKGSDMTAGYLRLENNQPNKITINSIECEKVNASIHETILNSEGLMKMKKLEMLTVDGESNLNFIPGGKHVMLSGLREFKENILVCAFLSNSGIEIPFTFEVLTNE